MKLKYYLRGLGIGIVVTALLMGIVTKDNGAMSDEEIKARAAQLGMVEQRTLADIRDNTPPTPAPEADTSKENEQPPVVTQEPERTAVLESTEGTPAPGGFEAASGSQDAEATDAAEEPVTA